MNVLTGLRNRIGKYPIKTGVIILLLLTAIIEGLIIVNLQKRAVETLPMYNFYNGEERVVVSGSWVSNTNLAGKYQTVEITCIKNLNVCINVYSHVLDGYLGLNTDIVGIDVWKDSEIVLKPLDTVCVRYETTIDLINEQVNSLRKTLDNKGFCEGIDPEPIYMQLTDGFERIRGN